MDINIRELDVSIIAPNSLNMHKSDQGGSKNVIIGKPGCFKKGTKILMYNGFIKNVEDIILGDIIMGDDGTPRNVLQLFHDYDHMYKIIPHKGLSYTVNQKHDLVLNYKNKFFIMSVIDYINNKHKFKICRSSGVDWPEKSLMIDPYEFGIIIGNQDIKFIPFEYKINSKINRFQLLAGIIDSIHITITRCGFELKMDSYIKNDFIFVVRSLGFIAYDEKDKIKVNADFQKLSSIPSKIYSFKNSSLKKDYLNTTFKIEYEGFNEYFGFELDSNHLFLLESFDIVKNTGKTTLITSLLYEKRDIFPTAMIMSGTEDSNGHYKKIVPSTFVFNKLDEKKIEDFIVRQKIAKKHIPNPWAILLLDDCTDDPKLFNKPLFQGLYKNGRHWKCWFLLSLQYCMDIKPVIRSNIDGVFILRETNLRNRKSLWENYAGVIPDFSMFCAILDQCTDNYTALYIHNATTSNKLEDCLFWYRAKPVPDDFKLGCRDMWKFHYHRFNNDYRDPYN